MNVRKKNQSCQFKLKFGTETNLNLQNSMVQFSFSVLSQKHPFYANLVQKVKIVSLSWNFVLRLIQTCRIQWCCSLSLFLDRKHLFWANLIQNVKIVSSSWIMALRLIRKCRIQWFYSLFLFWPGNTLFGRIWSNISKRFT